MKRFMAKGIFTGGIFAYKLKIELKRRSEDLYYIGTDKTFIAVNRKGKVVTTSKLKDAKFFQTKEKAGQFLVSLPRNMYSVCTKWEVKNYGDIHKEEISLEPQSDKHTQAEAKEERTDTAINMSDIDYLNILDTMSALKEHQKGCITVLSGKLSDIGQEIVDIEHYIEFNDLNACDGYQAYKMLRDCLRERRKIKDSITAAQSLYENCRVDKLCSCNDYLHNRTYTPRKLTSLFTNKE